MARVVSFLAAFIFLSQIGFSPTHAQESLALSVPSISDVQLVVFDVLGRRIETLIDERLEPGRYEAVLDGSQLATGMYLVRLTARPEDGSSVRTFTQRVTLVK